MGGSLRVLKSSDPNYNFRTGPTLQLMSQECDAVCCNPNDNLDTLKESLCPRVWRILRSDAQMLSLPYDYGSQNLVYLLDLNLSFP